MIEDRIQKIEARLQESANIPEAARAELLKLLAALKDEVGTLARSHEEDARSIAKFMDASAHEATRAEKKPKLIEAALNGLTASVEAIEASHPKLAEVVNQIAVVCRTWGSDARNDRFTSAAVVRMDYIRLWNLRPGSVEARRPLRMFFPAAHMK